jgi:phage portal protein BeeE
MKTLEFLRDNYFKKSEAIVDNMFSVSSSSPNDIVRRQSFVDYLLGKKRYDLASYVAVQYFCIVAPIDNSVTRLFTDISNIPLLIYDEKEEKFIDNHPLQELLSSPNFDDTREQFMEAFSAFFLITGDSYIIANSIDINSEPRQLFVLPPQNVEIQQDGDGNVLSYSVSRGAISTVYKQTLSAQGGVRYIATLSSGATSEIYHSLSFHPVSAYYNIKGKSPLTSIYYELEQYIASNTHNLSRLKRGTTLDGIFKTGEKLTDDQFMKLQSHIDEYWGSEHNAGRPFLAEGGLEFQANPKENKDMDYSKMRKDLKEIMYNHYAIPLPFVSPDTMTLANMEASTLRFYDEGVIPALNRLLADLTKFLMPRYKNSENLKIWYDQDTIPALEPRRNAQLKAKQELGIYTWNELRAMDRAAPIDGGQNIYGQVTQIPLAVDPEDPFTSGDELQTQESEQNARQGAKNAANIKNILSRYKDGGGNVLFSDSEIDRIVAQI